MHIGDKCEAAGPEPILTGVVQAIQIRCIKVLLATLLGRHEEGCKWSNSWRVQSWHCICVHDTCAAWALQSMPTVENDFEIPIYVKCQQKILRVVIFFTWRTI
jgi:hypothetical protein